jgi:DNA polymerase III alpha subunit
LNCPSQFRATVCLSSERITLPTIAGSLDPLIDTAKGFAFLAIEDPTGMVNVILTPDVYAQYRSTLQGAFVLIEGVVQKDRGAINVVAQRIEAI